jgi:glutamate-1-semialdehyde aminotransferase
MKVFGDGILPGGVPSVMRSAAADTCLVGGAGSICWDTNNKKYIDWVCGYGTLILGHSNFEVNRGVIRQLKKGMIFLSKHPLRDQLNAEIKDIFQTSENNLLLKTGSEAVSAAIRLARAFTNKPRIIRCGYHGWHDSMVSPQISWHSYEPDFGRQRVIPGVLQSRSQSIH